MAVTMKPKEATAIINSLSAGVVPSIGVQHITVGRERETTAFIQALNDVKNGHSMVKFWIGDFGSGKSFMLHLLNTVALKQKFVVANADFTPENRLYANDKKALALYSSIMDNIAIQTKPEGGALSTLLDKWIEKIILQTSIEHDVPISEIQNEQYHNLIKVNITQSINDVSDTGGFDLSIAIVKYFEGYINSDSYLKKAALKWLKGEYLTKTEAKADLGIRNIIDDSNYYGMLKNFCKLFVSIGYSGFMINFDEAINLYKISTSPMRAKNYEKILAIFNDCLQGKVENLFINFAGTNEFLENERRGLFSYDALKTRLETNKFETSEFRDFSQPVIKLRPLNHAEIFVLLRNLNNIFNTHYKCDINMSDSDIKIYMEDMFNKPGASDFLTPREVIRNFLDILNVLRQNPGMDKSTIIAKINIEDERPDIDVDDSIEVH